MDKTRPNAGHIMRYLIKMGEQLGRKSMPVPQHILLLHLFYSGDVPQKSIGDITGAPKQSVSRYVLELAGKQADSSGNVGPALIEDYYDPQELRSKLVRLTPQGFKLVSTALKESFKE